MQKRGLYYLSMEIVLVFDDYHVITNPSIHEGITFLLDHQPPNLHIVLLTRADPPLPLARLRAQNQLTEIRADDLRFTVDETSDFLRHTLGEALPDEDLRDLRERTEGWITGAIVGFRPCGGESLRPCAGYRLPLTLDHIP